MITAPHPDDAAARPENGQSEIQALKVKRHLRYSVFAGGFLETITVKNDSKDHWRIEREIRTRIKDRFDTEGIIMSHWSVRARLKERFNID